MFSFGQFAHLLPYLIIAVTSFIGWSSYALANQKAPKEPLDEKEIIVSDFQEPSTASTTYYFKQSQPNNLSTDFSHSDEVLLHLPLLNELPPGCLVNYSGSELIMQHHQRPPPASFIAS